MDGVIYRGKTLVDGAKDFIRRLVETHTPFLFLTNNSEQTPIDLLRKLEGMGIEGLTEQNFYTSAIATAAFLKSQKPGGTAYVIGGNAIANELYKAGFSLTETNPDYVVVGKTTSFNFDMLRKAARLIDKGAKFIATNPDVVDPTENGLEPASGPILAAIEVACGKKPYVVGKPNALMMMNARKQLGSHSSDTVMIGDRMDTDIVAGLEAGMTTCLVLSGVTTRETLERFPYRPSHVFNNVGEINLREL
jgi:NagD protein